jgi:hypothetical protein
MRADASTWRVDAPNWRSSACDCFRAVERRALNKMLLGAAHISAHSDDDHFAQHYRNVSIMLANAEALCVLSHDESRAAARTWVQMESEMYLYRLPPGQRRAQLLDPSDGPSRFLTLERRRQMLRDLDEAA